MMDISIVIVNYNTTDMVLDLLGSIYSVNQKMEFETFLVDNNSSDGTTDEVLQRFPHVKVISLDENVGFSKANNIALQRTTGRYVLLLNPDTLIQPDTLTIMMEFMDSHRRCGASGCKVIKPDGTLDLACRRSFPTPANALFQALGLPKLFPKSKLFASYNLTFLDEDEAYQVDCLVGAFMMVRREVIERVGLLDERFFMYADDIDWCYRIKQIGWEIWYYPGTQIMHYKGASSQKQKKRMIYEFHRSMAQYYDKHHAAENTSVVNGIVHMGIKARYYCTLLINSFKRAR